MIGFIASLATNGVGLAQFGVGFGRGGYGGYGGGFYPPAGVYGGYGGFGPGFYGGSGFGYPGYGFGNYGYGSGVGFYGNGFGNGYSYAQPLYTNFNQPNYSIYSQPLYSTRLYTPQVYTLRTFPPLGNSTSTYSGSSDIQTSPSPSYSLATPSVVSPGPASSSAISPAPSVAYDNGEIVIFSPPTNSREIQYTLNGAPYTMKPGTLQKFKNDRTWVVEVNPGSGQSTKFTLSAGRFKFKHERKPGSSRAVSRTGARRNTGSRQSPGRPGADALRMSSFGGCRSLSEQNGSCGRGI